MRQTKPTRPGAIFPAGLALWAVLVFPAAGEETKAAPAPKPAAGAKPKAAAVAKAPATDADRTLYVMGVALARTFQNLDLTAAELAVLKEGLSDAGAGRPLKVSPEAWGPKIPAFTKARLEKIADEERARSAAFTERIAAEPGTQRQPSGFLYRELKAGSGASPAPGQKVLLKYTGTLVDGTVFDSSAREGRPVVFDLSEVIPCFKDGVPLMKPGGRARLVCPAQLAYGDAGLPPKIRPGATLVFDVELVGLVK
jgi:FKBP-type peptidyl-prolyl cis-trans isomerase FkpA